MTAAEIPTEDLDLPELPLEPAGSTARFRGRAR